MAEFWELFVANVMDTTWLEVIAVVFGIASVWYSWHENILVYPTGIVSVLIYVYICFIARLYADAGIQVFYFGMSVYGWWNWLRRGNDDQPLRITKNSKARQWQFIVLTVLFFWAIIGIIWVFNRQDVAYMTSYVPWVDSVTTSIFLTGMLLMAFKKVENWIYWIIGDLISIPLYFSKGLVLTSFQYLVFLAMAVLGYLEWRRRLKLQHA